MTKKLKIITDSDPRLRKVSEELELSRIKDEDIQKLLQEMELAIEENNGLGLAAPQIGENIRIVVMKEGEKFLHLINPKITKRSWAKELDEEGCLSVPDCYGQVLRNKKINYLYRDKEGKKIKARAKGLISRVIQHEIDHLDGILFVDKASNKRKAKDESASS